MSFSLYFINYNDTCGLLLFFFVCFALIVPFRSPIIFRSSHQFHAVLTRERNNWSGNLTHIGRVKVIQLSGALSEIIIVGLINHESLFSRSV